MAAATVELESSVEQVVEQTVEIEEIVGYASCGWPPDSGGMLVGDWRQRPSADALTPLRSRAGSTGPAGESSCERRWDANTNVTARHSSRLTCADPG